MKVSRYIHNGYKQFEKLPKDIGVPQMFGKYQYVYDSDKGEISLIKLLNYFRDGIDLWEIFCLKGDLFEGTPRFSTKKEAEIEIAKYLTKTVKVFDEETGKSKIINI